MEPRHHRFIGGDLLEGRVPASGLFEGIESDVIEVRCYHLNMGCLLVLEEDPPLVPCWEIVVGFYTREDVSTVILTREETQGKMLRLRSLRHGPRERTYHVAVIPLNTLPCPRDRHVHNKLSKATSVSPLLDRMEVDEATLTIVGVAAHLFSFEPIEGEHAHQRASIRICFDDDTDGKLHLKRLTLRRTKDPMAIFYPHETDTLSYLSWEK